MPKTYFKIDQALDNTTMRIIEDSILCNPNIAKDDKDAIITHLCYSLPYEDTNSQRYTYHTAYKSITEKQIAQQQAAPELLDALKELFKQCAMIHKYGGEIDNTREANAAIQAAREAITKAEG